LEEDSGCLPFSDLALLDIVEMTNKDFAQNAKRFTRKTMKSRRFREMRDYTLRNQKNLLEISRSGL